MSSVLRAAWAGWVLALASAAAPARAQPTSDPSEQARGSCGGNGPRVLITWVDIAAPAAMERAVCDWFRDEPWSVHFAAASLESARADAALRLVVRLGSSSQARLQVHAPGEAAWSYDVTLPGPLDATGTEVLAQALHSTVQAALERAQRPAAPLQNSTATGASTTTATTRPASPASGSTSAPPTTTASATDTHAAPSAEPVLDTPALVRDVPASGGARVAPTPRSRPGSPLPVHTGLGYLALLRGDEPWLHGPTLRIAVDAQRQSPTLGGYFRGTLFTSSARDSSGLSLRSSGVSLGAGASLSAALTRAHNPLEARAALGAGVDLLALDVRVKDPTLARLSANRRARPRPFIGAETGVAWRTGSVELELSLLLRWQLLHTTYEARDLDGQRFTLFEPWRLQPGASLAAAYVW